MRVVFATCFLDKPTKQFVESLEQCLPAVEAAGWQHSYIQEIGCPYISAARATCIRKALSSDPDYIVFLDYDLSWTPESMVKLLAVEGEVIAGTYRFKRPEERYMGQLLPGPDGLQVRPDGCIRADKVPAGFLRVSRSTLVTFAKAYPHLLYGDPLNYHIDLFNHGVIDGVWYGEDYAFSKRWCDAGGELWIVPDLDIAHHSKGKTYAGNFHKYLTNYNKPAPITTSPLVSVVIPTYNYGQYIADTIRSVQEQTYKNIEIIVVDDGSTDNTLEVVAPFDGVRYIYQENAGAGAARNTGIAAASGEWIICLDSDDMIKPEYIESCLRVADADIITTGQQNFGDEHKILQSPPEVGFNDLVNANQIHYAAMFRKAVWEKIGGWDKNFRTGFEDWDFWLRATMAGFEIKSIPQPLFMYRKHGRSMIDDAKDRHAELREIMLIKNGILEAKHV